MTHRLPQIDYYSEVLTVDKTCL